MSKLTFRSFQNRYCKLLHKLKFVCLDFVMPMDLKYGIEKKNTKFSVSMLPQEKSKYSVATEL